MKYTSDDFMEISDEELEEYIKGQFGGTEEYEAIKQSESISGDIRYIDGKLKKAVSVDKRLLKELETYKRITSLKLIPELIGNIKMAWEKSAALHKYVDDDKKNADFVYPESSLLMNSNDITINKTDSGYSIILPVLIPHRKMAPLIPNYIESYRMPIYNALKRKFPDKRPLFKEKCNVSILHHFETERDMIDYDNFDYTHLLNCLASFFWTDDSPKYYRLMIDGIVDGRNYSEIALKTKKDGEG